MRFRTPLEGALFMAGKGFKVFPVNPNMKVPTLTGWQDWAEKATMQKVKDYGTANPMHNWGVYCGASDITVIDIDVKNGAKGDTNFAEIVGQANEKHAPTLTVATPSGGLHLYYKGAVKSCVLDRGIDIQSKGKYVVAPGALLDNKEYFITENTPIEVVTLPSWLRRKIEDKSYKEKTVLEDKQSVIEGQRNTTFMSIAGAMRSKGLNQDEIRVALEKLNERTQPPLSERELDNICKTVASYKPSDAKVAASFTPMGMKSNTLSLIDPKAIPKRDWVMKNRFVGGFISVLIAPGGIGKSTLSLLDAIAISTGRNLTGNEVIKKGAVWVYNTEDPREETERRAVAACIHHEIDLKELDNVHYSSSNDEPFLVAKVNKDGVEINQGAIEGAIEFIRDNNIILMVIDPFVRVHQCNENNNNEIDKVVECFQTIARRTGVAICLVHHTSKGGALSNSQTSDPDMYSARGATALINAARIAHVLTPMNEKESMTFNIPNSRRRFYFRVDNAKSNLQAPSEHADWYEKVSVVLDNGDYVGALKCANLLETAVEDEKTVEISDKRRVATYLDTILTVSDPNKSKIHVADIVEAMEQEPILEGVFDFAKKRDRQAKFITMLKEGLIYRNKMFVYEFDVMAAGPKKHWVVAKRKSIEGLDLADPQLDALLDKDSNFFDENGDFAEGA